MASETDESRLLGQVLVKQPQQRRNRYVDTVQEGALLPHGATDVEKDPMMTLADSNGPAVQPQHMNAPLAAEENAPALALEAMNAAGVLVALTKAEDHQPRNMRQ